MTERSPRARRRAWERRAADRLDAADWPFRTPAIHALGWHFGVRTDSPPLGELIDSLLVEMRGELSERHHWYSLLVRPRGSYLRHRLYRDGHRLLDTTDGARALRYLLWDVNQRLFTSTPDKLLIHAAVVEHGGHALVLTAPSESGKTTLTAGLVGRGLGYLTDEAAAIDPETLLVHPFPKALSIDHGAQRVLSHLRPRAEPAVRGYLEGQWQVPPSAIRPGAVSGPVPPRWIIVPRYVRDGETRLVPMTRAQTLAALMEQGLNLQVHGKVGFEVLGEVVRHARCAHLVMGDLPSACDAVMAMLEEDLRHG